MIVQLAPIRPHDLRPGDILQHRDGTRRRLERRWALGWYGWNEAIQPVVIAIPDTDIEHTGTHRLWWLDEAVERT